MIKELSSSLGTATMLPLESLLAALRQTGLLSPDQSRHAERLAQTADDYDLVPELHRQGILTGYQAGELREGRGAALLLDSYVLLDMLGEGGMGEVFRACHLVMHRDVAIKRIRPKCLGSAAMIERFLREVRAASKLSHPNVVQVYDAGEAGGVHFLAMELLSGVTLASYAARKGPLPVAEAVEYVRQACLGMQHAHEKELVHRDLKPGNLMLCDNLQVKVMDLGLALAADTDTLTQDGGVFGTVDYLAPEQVKNSHQVDIRADVYSLGCTLYHLLAGKTPFEETHPAARPSMHLNEEPRPLETRRRDVTAAVAGVVRKMMAKKRENRYQTPGEAARALAELLGRHDAADRTAIPSTDPGDDPRRTRVPAAGRPTDVRPPADETPVEMSLFSQHAIEPVIVDEPPRYEAAQTSATLAGQQVEGKSRFGGLAWPLGIAIAAAAAMAAAYFGGSFLASLTAKKTEVVVQKPNGGDNGKLDGDKEKDGKDVQVVKDRDKVQDKDREKDPNKDKEKDRKKDKDRPLPLEDEFTNRIVGMKFVRVKAGTFRMGSPKEEKDRNDDEEPRHAVTITKDYWLGVTEVTQGQFRTVMGYNPSYFSHDGKAAEGRVYPKNSRPGGGAKRVTDRTPKQLDDFPVENVSWEEAQEFIAKLNKRADGLDVRVKYRLPSEAEWEYACRGGGDRAFHFGDALSSSQANLDDGDVKSVLGRTQKVGSYPHNALGLYDMHGNVAEWCEDGYGSYPVTDPKRAVDEKLRVIRGGGWVNSGAFCRSACRNSYDPTTRSYLRGFRVAVVPVE